MTFSTDTLACLSDLTDISAWVDALEGPPAANSNVDGASAPPAQERPQRLANARERADGAAALVGECARVANAPPGGRNDTLNRAAFSIGTAVGAGWITEADARAALMQAATDCGSMQDNPREVRLTINSGLRSGMRHPRDPLPMSDEATGNVVPIRPETPPSPAAIDAAFSRLLWDDAAAADDHVEWMVKNTVPRRGIGIMPGQSTMGKSFCALDLAGSLATGTPWFDGRTRMRGGTLFLLGEAALTMRPRLKALREGKLASVPTFDAVSGEVLFDLNRLPIVMGEVSQLSAPAQLAAAEALVARVAAEMVARHGVPLRLVVVDTALAAFGFPEEPDMAQVQDAANKLKVLADACDGFALALHHHGKSVEAGAAGSFMWRGAFDMEFSITGKRRPDGTTSDRRVRMEKNRYGPIRDMGGFDLVAVEVGRDEDDDPIMGAYVMPEAATTTAGELGSARTGTAALSKAGRVLMDCLGATLASHGYERALGMGGAMVRVVAMNEVKALFRVRYAPGGPPERQDNAIRMAFKRGVDAARVAGRVMVREIDGVEVAWSMDGLSTTRDRLDRMEPPFSRMAA